jgi:hypothetical protein
MRAWHAWPAWLSRPLALVLRPVEDSRSSVGHSQFFADYLSRDGAPYQIDCGACGR